MVAEYIDGPSLREAGPLSGAALYRLAIGTATALTAIHQAGIVHRDLKPGNVLLAPDGPRVIDFGIARSTDATHTASSSVLGTPSYMAPEQLGGEPVGPAADVFAWGATITFAATGHPPYGQDTIPAVMNRILTGEPDLGLMDDPLRALILQCLAKDPSRRPQSHEVLLRLLEHTGTPIAPPEALAQGRRMAATAQIADERTTRWTTLRLSPMELPVRPRARRLSLLAGAVAGVVIAGTAGIVAVRMLHETPPTTVMDSVTPAVSPAPSDRQMPEPRTPAQVAVAIEQAVSVKKAATITLNGAFSEGQDGVNGKGRLYYRHGHSTDYDVVVRNPNFTTADYEYGGSPERIILIGDDAYPPTGGNPIPVSSDPDFQPKDIWVYLAMETRVATAPDHIFALLTHGRSITRTADQGTYTFQGRATISRMRQIHAISTFYTGISGDAVITFTIVLTRDFLPKRLDVNLMIGGGTDSAIGAAFATTYTAWGTSGTVAKPY